MAISAAVVDKKLAEHIAAFNAFKAQALSRLGALEAATPLPAPIPPVPGPTPTPPPVVVPDPIPTPAPGGNLTPSVLIPTLGPLIARPANQAEPFLTFDANFLANEPKLYAAHATDPNVTLTNHYGFLRSRIQHAIRMGQPFGQAAIDPQYLYGRGRAVVIRYLDTYAKPNAYNLQPHNSTGLPDSEILYLLEGKQEARDHIWSMAAHWGTYSAYGYWDYTTAGDPRIVAISLQALSAAHRLGIPFQRPPNPNLGFNNIGATSWLDAGERKIAANLASPHLKADGAVHSLANVNPPECGFGILNPCECFFMSAMLATELLRWHGFVKMNGPAYSYAIKIVDHLIAKAEAGSPMTLGGPLVPWCLPYTGTCAPDTSGFFVWPAAVLWQETGADKYRDFALKNVALVQQASTYLVKQFAEAYSTGAQSAPALLAGVPWRGV